MFQFDLNNSPYYAATELNLRVSLAKVDFPFIVLEKDNELKKRLARNQSC